MSDYFGGELPVYQISVELPYFPCPKQPKSKPGRWKNQIQNKKEKNEIIPQNIPNSKQEPEFANTYNDWDSYQSLIEEIQYNQLKMQSHYYQT